MKQDVAIIGAGPVGLFAVFECGMLKMGCHVVDALDMVGGQCVALYPEKPIYDIPGYPEIDAASLVDKLARQAAPFAPAYHLGQQVTAIARGEDGSFALTTSLGNTITTKAVVIAAGVGAFGPNRRRSTALPSSRVRASSISSADARISGTSASSSPAAAIRRSTGPCRWPRSPPRHGDPPPPEIPRRAESAARLQRLADEGRIDLVVPYQLHALEGAAGQLDHVVVADLDGGTKRLPADALLAFYGLAMDLGPIAQWASTSSATTSRSIPRPVPPRYRDLRDRDIATYRNKLKLILTGFAEAAMAAHAIHPLVHPGEALHFEYSTTKGLPGRS